MNKYIEQSIMAEKIIKKLHSSYVQTLVEKGYQVVEVHGELQVTVPEEEMEEIQSQLCLV